MKIGFIGPGKMTQAIISGLTDKSELLISGRDLVKTQAIAAQLGAAALSSNLELVKASELVILAVKPQMAAAVLSELTDALKGKTLVSIAAGLSLADLAELTSPEQAIIRVMPNVNAAIQRSTSAITWNDQTTESAYTAVQELFSQVGTVHKVAEKDFSALTALAGSSPAFIALFIDALARAGVLHGLPKAQATRIAAETLSATAEHILSSGKQPQTLADEVASPAGTTIAGIAALESHAFTAAVLAAVTATIDRDKGLK